MKKLIFIHGTNGVGKSTLCKALHQHMENSAWLESEWTRTINPFILNDETEELTESNMTFLLRNYLNCSLIKYVIFNWGFHGRRKRIFERVLNNLKNIEFEYIPITITCDEDENIRRMKNDERNEERIERALLVREIYENLDNQIINTTNMSVDETVNKIIKYITEKK